MSETTSFPFMGSSLHTVRPCRASGMTTFAVGIGGVATGVFTPGSLPGIQFWYDAGAISGVTSGTSLSVWTDMSGNERHASNSLVTEQPLYVNNIINGYPGVRFVPNNDVLVAPTSGITVDGWTAFCVSVLSTAAGTNDIWVNNRYTMGAATDSAIVITLGVKTYTSNVSFFTAGTAVLYTQVFQSGATANFYKNGRCSHSPLAAVAPKAPPVFLSGIGRHFPPRGAVTSLKLLRIIVS